MKPIYTITGTVVHGRGIGETRRDTYCKYRNRRIYGFTRNRCICVRNLLDNRTYYGITHVGTRPTLDNDKAISVETHIFEFDNDIYGCTITIHLYKKLREVRKFDELSLLIEQVAIDRLSAQKFWGLEQTNCALYIDVKKHCVMIGRQEVYLSTNEFKVFYLLYASPHTTFTKEQIYEKIWHEPANNHLHAVENTIFQIRKRLKPYCKEHEYIKTVIGYGINFILISASAVSACHERHPRKSGAQMCATFIIFLSNPLTGLSIPSDTRPHPGRSPGPGAWP